MANAAEQLGIKTAAANFRFEIPDFKALRLVLITLKKIKKKLSYNETRLISVIRTPQSSSRALTAFTDGISPMLVRTSDGALRQWCRYRKKAALVLPKVACSAPVRS